MEYSDTQVLLIQNFSNYGSLNIEMVKYQTTDDIWGFSLNGRRKEDDFDTYFALNDKVKLVTKDTPFSTLTIDENAMLLDNEDSDQNEELLKRHLGDVPSKAIKF